MYYNFSFKKFDYYKQSHKEKWWLFIFKISFFYNQMG